MDFDYLTRRMIEERQRASAADNDAARQAHRELAEHYARQLESLRHEDDGGAMQAMMA
jgi:hypothetical protein